MSSDIKHLPDSLPGLDIKKGVKLLAGSESIYLKILKVFCEDKENLIRDIRNSVNKGDYDKAGRFAHQLKGAAGAIAATEVYDAANVLYTCCRIQHLEMILSSIGIVEDALKKVFESSKEL